MAFDILQQNDDADEDEDEDEDAMAEDTAAPKVIVATNVFELETDDSNLATDDPAAVEETDEIT